MKRSSGCNSGCIVIVVVLMVGSLIFAAVYYYRASQSAAPFRGLAKEAQVACAQCTSLTGETQGAYPSVRLAQVLPVDALTGGPLGQAIMTLPDGLKPVTSEEVAYWACVGKKEERQTGTYRDGAQALQIYRRVCLVERSSGKVLISSTVYGSSPPQTKSGSGSKSGTDPLYRQIGDWLAKWMSGQ